MKLYLVQHGEALAKEADPERPLTPQGEHDLQHIAALLGRLGVLVGRVVHSGKLRARQSAEILAGVVTPGREPQAIPGIEPLDPVKPFARQVKEWCDDAVVVGHLPFLARLVAKLVGADPEYPPVAYRPGTLVCLERDTDGVWQVAWMVRPELLQDG